MKTIDLLRPWKSSIRIKIGITLLVIITGTLSLFGIYQYLDIKSNNTKELNELADLTIARLAEQLILPLWEVDNLWVRKIIISEMRDKRIYAISVSGAGDIFEEMKRDSQHPLVDSGDDISGDFIIRSRDVVRTDTNIGSVKLYITKRFMIIELKRETAKLVLTTILLSVFFIFFLSLLLHKIVIHPISLIHRYAVAIANGDYEQDIAVTQQDEIGTLGLEFNRMKENIRQRKDEMDRAEEALRESEERFRNLVESSSDWVWEVDQNGVYTYTDPNVLELLGYDVDEVLGKTPFDFMPPGEAERIGDYFKTLVASQQPITNLENINTHKDGHLIYLETSGVPIFSPNGEFLGYRGTDRDITERKLAEKDAQSNEYRIEIRLKLHQTAWATEKEIMDFSLEEMLNITESKIGYVAFMNENETVLTMYSWSTEVMEQCKVAGKPIVYPVETTGLWGEAVRQRKAVITNDYSAPNPFKKGIPEGHVKVVRHMNVPVFDGDRIVMVAGVGNKEDPYTDSDTNQLTMMMTDTWQLVIKRRAEEALRESERRLKESQQIARIGQWELDLTSNRLYWSDGIYDLFEVDPDKFTASYEAFLEAIHPQDRDFVNEAYSESIINRIPYDITHRLLLKDGTIKYVNEICRTEYDKDGNAIRSIGTVQDITELKQAEQELRRHRDHLEELVKERTSELGVAKESAETANRAKSVFLANMSHELRTPLNAVLGFSRLMRDDPQSTSSQQEKLDIINRSGKHLLTLINDVLDMSKIEAGRTVLEASPFDLGELMRDLIDMMRIRAEEKGLQLLLDQSSQFPRFVDGDAPKLRQIIINLLSNAVKFTEQGGVTLRLSSQPGRDTEQIELLCEVEDSGPGIAAEELERIFKPFVQLGEQAGQEGTGLGLTITRQYVELMGGGINAESEPGKGALFRFSLPVKKAQESDIAALSPAPGRVAGLAPDQPEYRILIAEDQPDNQLLLKTLLEKAGLTTRGALNGRQAVELFEQWRPQLIFMDWRMPVMDGMEATKQIRALPHGKEPCIVALTASALTDERHEIMASGHDEFISKPFRSEEIFGCLQRLLGIEFIYTEGEEQATTGELPEAAPQVSAGQLQALAPALLGALQRAVLELDVDQSMALIDEIAEVDPSLAAGLLHYVDALDFMTLQRLLEHSGHDGSGTADSVMDQPDQ
jgi:PAS domain S-box-containing protein